MNPLSQRTSVQTSGTAFASQPANWAWGYDALGQVVSADSPTPAFDRGYTYDLIGNRTSSTDNTALTTYAANALNQYSQISPPSPSSPVVPLHDDDGNQIDAQIRPLGSSSLVSCVFHWDAENRLVAVKDKATNAVIVSYTYDSGSRRVARTEGSNTTAYLYDGWNCVAEYSLHPSSFKIQTSNTWGLDLSGSLQGAGGVGGLLATRNEQLATSYFPAFDGNGNASEYLSASGAVSAHYEYDPFGRTIVASLLETANLTLESFPYRFSTKPVDASTGLYYYGYRWYDSEIGRWNCRDAIAENGGANLYAMVSNNVIVNHDLLGNEPMTICDGNMVGKNASSFESEMCVYLGKCRPKIGIKKTPFCIDPDVELPCPQIGTQSYNIKWRCMQRTGFMSHVLGAWYWEVVSKAPIGSCR